MALKKLCRTDDHVTYVSHLVLFLIFAPLLTKSLLRNGANADNPILPNPKAQACINRYLHCSQDNFYGK